MSTFTSHVAVFMFIVDTQGIDWKQVLIKYKFTCRKPNTFGVTIL